MLGKLLKYEFRASAKSLVPILLAIPALGIVSAAVMILNTKVFGGGEDSILSSLFSAITGMFLFFSIFAIAASFLVITFLILQRYFRNFFGDEGYLTFTLPATVDQHLIAKTVSGYVWMILGGISILISIAIIVLFGSAPRDALMNTEILKTASSYAKIIAAQLGAANVAAYIAEFALVLLVSPAAQLLFYYLSITVGSIIAKKHKVLASIGMYFAFNTGVGILSNIVMVIVMLLGGESFANDTTSFGLSHLYIIASLALSVIMGIVSYIIARSMLKNKLNLE